MLFVAYSRAVYVLPLITLVKLMAMAFSIIYNGHSSAYHYYDNNIYYVVWSKNIQRLNVAKQIDQQNGKKHTVAAGAALP